MKDGGGSVVVIRNQLLEACTERLRGFVKALETSNARTNRAPVLIAGIEDGGTVYEDGVAAAHRILAAGSTPSAIFALNDPSALGVYSVFKDRAPENIPHIFSFDASEKGIEAVRRGEIVVTVKQDPDSIGSEAIRVVVRHLCHESVPSEILIPASLYKNF